jgi:hypothetical protein
MHRTGIPEKAIKILSARKKDLKKKKKGPSQEDRGSHHELAYYVHRYLTT